VLTRIAAGLLSGSGASSRLLILMYHRVLEQHDPFLADTVSASEFAWQMALLSRHYRPFTLQEAARRLADGTLPRRAVVVSFDDGYRDNFETALPVLLQHGIPATFFIATGFLGNGRMWNDTVIEALRRSPAGELDLSFMDLGRYTIADDADRVSVMNALIGKLKYRPMEERQSLVDSLADRIGESLPNDLMMSRDQVGGLFEAGMEIGGHTCHHPILSNIDLEEAQREIVSGQAVLQEITGSRVTTFAYPNGRPGQDYRHEHTELLRNNGFEAAVSTAWGCATRHSDSFQLPRIAPWDRTPLRFNLRLLRAYRESGEDRV